MLLPPGKFNRPALDVEAGRGSPTRRELLGSAFRFGQLDNWDVMVRKPFKVPMIKVALSASRLHNITTSQVRCTSFAEYGITSYQKLLPWSSHSLVVTDHYAGTACPGAIWH